jgi:hypothetical protein
VGAKVPNLWYVSDRYGVKIKTLTFFFYCDYIIVHLDTCGSVLEQVAHAIPSAGCQK